MAAGIKAGKLRHRLEIQARTATQDSFGDALTAWATVATRWASIEPQSGRETWRADQQQPDTSGTITIRYFAGLTPRHRLVKGSRVFNIESVVDVEDMHVEMRVAYREEV